MDLRAWRESQDLTLAALAAMVGMSTATISQIENGNVGCLSHALMERICGVTGGAVTAAALHDAWRRENKALSSHLRAAGRSAAAAYRAAAKSKPRK